MKKVFVDTNIIIDLLAERKPFYKEAAVLFTLADKKQLILYVSALTFANTYYIFFQLLKAEKIKPQSPGSCFECFYRANAAFSGRTFDTDVPDNFFASGPPAHNVADDKTGPFFAGPAPNGFSWITDIIHNNKNRLT